MLGKVPLRRDAVLSGNGVGTGGEPTLSGGGCRREGDETALPALAGGEFFAGLLPA